jgi:tellurite resistance protein TerC
MIKYARRIVILVVGMTVLLIGIAMIVLPGPAIIVIPIGLAILATEYAWARHWLRIIRKTTEKGADKLRIRSFFSQKANPNQQDAPRSE